MNAYVQSGDLYVAENLHSFVSNRLLPYTSLSADELWQGLGELLAELSPINESLLAKRDHLQSSIDDWHKSNKAEAFDVAKYKHFLRSIGYLVDEGPDFNITTTNVDPEISQVAGPQLVVPVSNARFALNAANARWGSLYDALYGTDVIPFDEGLEKRTQYNSQRGERVIRYAADFLDKSVPLASGSHFDVVEYSLEQEPGTSRRHLFAKLANSQIIALAEPDQFKGYLGHENAPSTILLQNNGLHIEVHIDRSHPIGAVSASGTKDIILEAALTVIQDFEDSVATVDASDKVAAYENWAGLMDGSLEDCFNKSGKQVRRRLNADRIYIAADGNALSLPGRSLMFVRNVGHLTTTDCVLDKNRNEVPEGFLDAFITVLCALPDLKQNGGLRNSKTGSIYIVKPKMHGPEEVTLTDTLFTRIEQTLGLAPNCIKIGVMDEERRTSVNLKECIRAVKDRIVFINTGFLDRTGDEIHTNMEAGPVLPKEQIKTEQWLQAYEERNVAIGLACGFHKKAQIGKGMWPKPDEMAQMVATKHMHLEAGANCAWVPSPTAAVLHAMHYHQTCVFEVQQALGARDTPSVEELFRMPLLSEGTLSEKEIQTEINNNLQGILGYVVRWVDQGVGCSKVPDIHDVGLMEDRATLRISSQHVANWLYHGMCSEDQVRRSFKDMAAVVDQQNARDPQYRPMAQNTSSDTAFIAASDLVFKGRLQPNGYTELILRQARCTTKSS